MKTCLVVDDSRVIRKVSRRIVEDLGYDVVEAEDGLEALNACRTAMPEAILVDWRLPRLSGLEFVRQLRGIKGGERPVVIFCSVESDPARISEALDAGAAEYVIKPFDSDIMRSKFVEAGLS